MYELRERIISLQRSGRKIHRLDIGEVEPRRDDWVLETVRDCISRGVRYGSSGGSRILIDELCRAYGAKPENVIIGPGSKYIIYALIKTLGREVFTIEPAWPAYKYMAADLGLKYSKLETRMQDGWQPPLEAFSRIEGKTAVLNTPSNPTSTVLRDLDGILERLERGNNFTILDLAYNDLAFDEKKAVHPEFKDDRALIYTFSKRHGLSGWRIGFAIVPEALKKKYDDFVSITINNVPEVVQEVAARALRTPNPGVVEAYRDMAAYACSAFRSAGYECADPDAGIYVFVNVKRDGYDTAMRLLDHGFAVMPGRVFGDECADFIRVCLPRNKEILDSLLAALDECRL